MNPILSLDLEEDIAVINILFIQQFYVHEIAMEYSASRNS
jgi:hypothetical protein